MKVATVLISPAFSLGRRKTIASAPKSGMYVMIDRIGM